MTPTPAELKKTLVARGFEVYRTLGDQVVLADRVRDNLIMDSGVAARPGAVLSVRFVVRAQASDFPSAKADELYARARECAAEARRRGYSEVGVAEVPVRDPGDASSTLDTWYEVSFERPVANEDELEQELRYALALEKTVTHAVP
jgi:sugar phosphate isomerase/epimerase